MTTPRGAHRAPLTRREMLLAALAVVGLVGLIIGSYLAGVATSQPASAQAITVTAPAPSSAPVPTVDPDQAPAPGMDPKFAPPDGPALDSPPFDVDAVAMRDELRTHGVDTPDAKLGMLVSIADKYISQGDMDLDAWDPRIKRDVRTMYPEATKNEVIDVTRCLAEYVERVEARNAGLPHPPDEDDHNITVDGRGPVPH